jgi:zinc protease
VETLFELVYLYFTAPREDDEAVTAFLERQRAAIANRSANPDAAFGDTLQVTLSQHHPRSLPLSVERLQHIDVAAAHAFYRDRFADAGDFTFVLVGNLDMEVLTPLVQSYLGALPSTGRQDTWRDTGIRPPEGVVERVVRQGIEPRSRTSLVFTGPMEYSREDAYALSALADALEIRLREVLREDLGGTYNVQVGGSVSRRPEDRYTLDIRFGAAPERLDELVGVVFDEIERFKAEGPREQGDRGANRRRPRPPDPPGLQGNDGKGVARWPDT